MASISYSFIPKLSTPTFANAHFFYPNKRNFKIICCLSSNETTKQTTETLRIAFAAGRTGGHIYPAVAIADELKTLNPNTEILFIGTPTGMESTAIPTIGYPFVSVPEISLHNPFVFPYFLIKSLIKSFQILQEFNPEIVVGTGGRVSFPICLAAAIKGHHLVIQEQNSVPGMANRVLSLFSERVFVAFNSSVECFWQRHKCIVCGNPVRLSLNKNLSKVDARKHFFPMEEGKVVLVLGGTLAANAINIALLHSYYQMLSDYGDLFIIWQTGLEAFDEMESLVKKFPRLILTPFLHSMDMAYAAADLVVSRAGAMTCYEILATGKPCILIPSPNVDEGHQLKNAYLMADLAGPRVIEEDELDSMTLRHAIVQILENEDLRAKMSQRALQAAKPNASTEIAHHILSLINSSS